MMCTSRFPIADRIERDRHGISDCAGQVMCYQLTLAGSVGRQNKAERCAILTATHVDACDKPLPF